MDIAAILALVTKIAAIAPTLIQDAQAAAPILKNLADIIKGGKAVSQADFDALHARIDALTADIEAPIP